MAIVTEQWTAEAKAMDFFHNGKRLGPAQVWEATTQRLKHNETPCVGFFPMWSSSRFWLRLTVGIIAMPSAAATSGWRTAGLHAGEDVRNWTTNGYRRQLSRKLCVNARTVGQSPMLW